jgi:hypothetical protein
MDQLRKRKARILECETIFELRLPAVEPAADERDRATRVG